MVKTFLIFKNMIHVEKNMFHAADGFFVEILINLMQGNIPYTLSTHYLTKGYAKHESETLIETIKSRRSVITAKSTPDDVLRQEGVISEALGRIAMVTEQYPELKANQTYIKTMDAVETFENMVRTSRLIYNDSVTKLNREIRMFPVSMIAGMLGFQQKKYLEEQASKADMPSMK